MQSPTDSLAKQDSAAQQLLSGQDRCYLENHLGFDAHFI